MLYPGVEGKFGVDYSISQQTTAGITITGNYENGKDESENTSFMSDASGNLAKIIEAQNLVRPNYRNLGVNGNMRHKLDSAGKEISFDVDYIFYDFSSAQNLNSRFFNAEWIKNRPDENLQGDLPSKVNIYSAKSDYTYPLKKDAKLEAGLKYSHVTTDNNAKYYLVQNGQTFFDSSRSNHFLYTENIAAAYINYNKQWKKWGVQLGLRGENTIGKGEQKVNSQKIDRNIFNLFPTMYVSYAANDKNQFAASFGRRIERPSYQDLNPFRYFLDPYTYQEGNPFLKPQFSYNYQLSHNYKSILNTSVSYNKTTDIFAETLNQYDSLKITYVYKDNISTAINYGISVSANFNVTKWWSTSLYTNVTHNKYEGLIRNKPLNVSSTFGTFNMSNQLKFGKGWSGEVGGFARTKGIEGQILINPMGQLNFGVQKQILKAKGTLKLSVKDAFYTMPFHGKFEFHNIDVKVDQSRDSRTVGLTFNYRFGKASEQKRQRQSGAEDEQNRVKKGGGN
jgi:outer membrane receptor protein involved in Fe transport